jgi:hypothetical protein
MSDHRARLERDVYDHQDEQPTPSGRRRGPVADWGVGEELFEQMPRRRFARGGEEPGRHGRERRAPEPGDVPRGPVDDGRPTLRIGSDDDVPSEIAAVTADRDLGEAADPVAGTGRARDQAAELDRGWAPQADEREDDLGTATARPQDDAPEVAADAVPPRSTTGDPGRRTVKIEGRPEGALPAARFHEGPQRLRPRRTAGERLGARPDRLAAWAFVLGLLLILIAVLSSLL